MTFCCKWMAVFLMLLIGFPLPGCGSEKPAGPVTSFREVGDYIKAHHRLPDNFITKKEAGKLGWTASRGNLWAVAPGKSIGGDVFHNREKKLPVKSGRVWYEADINYTGGKRNQYRMIYSNDGLIYITEDHYRTFKEIGP